MSILDLTLRRNDAEGVVVATPLFGRLVFVIFTVTLIAGMGLQGVRIVPLLLSLVSALGALYTDRWTAMGSGSVLHHSFGIVPFLKKKEFQAVDVESLVLVDFFKGFPSMLKSAKTPPSHSPLAAGAAAAARASRRGPKLHYTRLVIRFHDGDEQVVETTGGRGRERLKSCGLALAEACDRPLLEE